MTKLAGEEISAAEPVGTDVVRTYWGVVIGAFRSRVVNRIALSWILLLVVITVLVPFIANGQPLTIVLRNPPPGMRGTGPVRVWPLLATLSNIDLAVLVFAVLALVYAFLWRRARRRGGEMEEIRARRVTSLGLLLLLGALASVMLFALHTPYNAPYDYRDYRRLLSNGEAHGAVFAPIPWHYGEQEPLEIDRTNEKPSREHWLGTDQIGRDALSRLLWSTRIVMGIGFISVSIALLIGVTIGALIGYFVGKVDLIGMRLVEIFESIPTFFLILIFIAIYGRQIFVIMIILGLAGWTGTARFVRAEVLKLRSMDYVQAALASGLSVPRVIFRHILPNGLTPVIVIATFGVAGAIMSESGLSFLGVGVEPPTPSWGAMLNDAGNPAETFRWWLALPPGIMIFLTVFAYNIIGEGMRDALDPRINRIR